MPADTSATSARRSRSLALAVAGLAVTLAGVVGYFVVVLRFGAWLPRLRNDAVPSWIAVLAGVALSALAITRATRGRRLVASLVLGLNVVVAAAFASFLYVVSAVPEAPGPRIGVAAPDFALRDQGDRTLRLADFRGKPLLLVFYRGHW